MTADNSSSQAFWQAAEQHLRGGEHDLLLRRAEARLVDQPRDLAANLAKGDALMALGRLRSAGSFYSASLKLAQSQLSEQPFTRSGLERAQAALSQLGQIFAQRLVSAMTEAGLTQGREHARMRDALDITLGGQQRPSSSEEYPPRPTVFFFPGLETVHYADSKDFAWTETLTAALAAIDQELDALIASPNRFEPYLTGSPLAPTTATHDAVGDDGWGAMHLHQVGKPITDHLAMTPATSAALAALPVPQVPGKSPNILFSRLKSGMHIPPHHGQTNTRLIGHLPLRTPPTGAWLRVGSERREHHRGDVLLFDDSVEHEAKNESSDDRIVLIFDVWRPEITAEEQRLIAALFAAIQAME